MTRTDVAKYGILAVVVAILCWVLSERRTQVAHVSGLASRPGLASVRPTFSPPPETPITLGATEGSRQHEPYALAESTSRRRAAKVTVPSQGVARGSSQAEEVRQVPVHADVDQAHETRSEEPPAGAATDVATSGTQHPVRGSREPSRNERHRGISGQTKPVVRTEERSTARSAVIVAGAAAAGAAIGGATGGGKGAAIGAITAGAGGYIYDRLTRRRTVPTGSSPTSPDPDDAVGTDQAGGMHQSDRDLSLARRFGTPAFN